MDKGSDSFLKFPFDEENGGKAKKATTINEIAKYCGVSAMTVSNIMNHKGRASEATRIKVMEVIQETHYSPNAFARNLKANKIKTIGIIAEDLTVFNTPEIVDGIEAYCEHKGYEVLIDNLRFYKLFHKDFYDSNQHHAHITKEIKKLLMQRIEGVIYVGCHERKLSIDLSEIPVPVVLVYSLSTDQRVPCVVFDDEMAAFDAVHFLIANNYRRIGLICGEKNSIHTTQRILGYRRALAAGEISYDPSLVTGSGWEYQDGYKACEILFAQHADSIFAMNDLLAGGVITYAYEHHLSVGKDVALIGFDDREICTAYTPSLSTIALPLPAMGRKAAKVLFSLLDRTFAVQDDNIIKIPCQLVLRDSIIKKS